MILHINSKNRRFNKTKMFKYLGTHMDEKVLEPDIYKKIKMAFAWSIR